MRVIAGIVVAACSTVLLVAWAGLSPKQLPPSPIGEATGSKPAGDSTPGKTGSVIEPVRHDIRNVTPDRVLPGPRLDSETVVRLPAIIPPPPPPRPPAPERWQRALVVAPGVFKSGKETIVIAGIEPVADHAMCTGVDAGKSWPCGNFAKAALRRLVRQRAIECDPVTRATGGPNDRIVTHCRVSGRDIGEWMVEQGWAKPAQDGGYKSAYEKAREAGLGQWRRQAQAALPEPALPDTGLTAADTLPRDLIAPDEPATAGSPGSTSPSDLPSPQGE